MSLAVMKPASLVSSLVFVGTAMFTVSLAEAFAVNEPTSSPFLLMTSFASLAAAGTSILTVSFVPWLAVNVPTFVPFFWMVNVPSFTVGSALAMLMDLSVAALVVKLPSSVFPLTILMVASFAAAGTSILTVSFVPWLAVNVPTFVPFFWMVNVPSFTVGIVGVLLKSL